MKKRGKKWIVSEFDPLAGWIVLAPPTYWHRAMRMMHCLSGVHEGIIFKVE